MPTTGQPRRAADNDVTVGEVNRNVVDLRQVMTEFISEVRTSYIRRDVYDAERQALTSYMETVVLRLDKVEDAMEERTREAAANRRLAITAVLAPILVGIIVALFTIQFGH